MCVLSEYVHVIMTDLCREGGHKRLFSGFLLFITVNENFSIH